ncbi:putative bifunctional diguanylate cyclase/phosphodiesterase [Spirochaeta thermophila]|uniref:Diguanylate cyclase/phosphodiesterase n=1 Tax=Winmispira thermophila (strain ATCC 49972 / DSM 6192 / RI 19.B1) TaxID=665571 RepID=E0RR89_WINT6|nr:GGDEF domain-containing phosphodiesterase [Spirochaeta thermophila]ADN03066.1 hypothetical protein STHERM_c21360 [Spirochaeta thermophila DSM 6192]
MVPLTPLSILLLEGTMNDDRDDRPLLDRDDVPEDIKAELILFRKQNRILQSKLAYLIAQNKKLKDLLEKHKRAKEIAEYKLSIHPVTGLPNHYRMSQDLPFILRKSQEEHQVALFIVKLDRSYNMLSKTLKPTMTEWILYQTGMRIAQLVGTENHLYHTREDEFIVVATTLTTEEEIISLAREISQTVKRPHIFSGYHISIGSYIGIALYPDHGFNKHTLLHNADIAMEYAMEQNTSFEIFKDELRERVVERMDLQQFLIKSLEAQAILEIKKQFDLFFQPILTLEPTGEKRWRITRIDAEALIRWHHPTKGLLLPNKFIPVAEETGVIMLLGTWVLYTAADTLREWEILGSRKPLISINISPVQFANTNLEESIAKVLESREIDTSHLMLELTENVVMQDPMESIKKMQRIREYGIKFALDDFGTGYSSLNYLKSFPISYLKLDRTFFKDTPENAYDKAIVRSVITLARELSLGVIAEGVETEAQCEFLLEEGCTTIQGFLFSRPRDSESFLHFVQNWLDREVELPSTPLT